MVYRHEVAGTVLLEGQMGRMMADLDSLSLAESRSIDSDSNIMGQIFYLNGIPCGFHHPV